MDPTGLQHSHTARNGANFPPMQQNLIHQHPYNFDLMSRLTIPRLALYLIQECPHY